VPQLALQIIEEFRNDVQSKGAKFYIVYLPSKDEILRLQSRNLPNVKLLEYLKQEAAVIHPENKMLKQTEDFGLNTLFAPKGHYSFLGNKYIADAIEEYLSPPQVPVQASVRDRL